METSVNPQFKYKKAIEELNPEIEKIETEDEIMASLATYKEWEVLRDKIKNRIEVLESCAKVTQETIGLVESAEMHGFKCMVKDLVVEELENIIDSVELPAKFLKEQKNESVEGISGVEG